MTTPRRPTVASREQTKLNAPRGTASARGLHRWIDPQETLDNTAQLACSILKADVAAISLADEEGYLTINSNVGMSARAAARWRRPFSEGPFGVVLRTRRPYISMDGTLPEDLAPGLSLYGVLIVPLRLGENIIGCLGVGYKRRRKLSKQDIRLAVLFASYASIAIETGALWERERHERQRSDALVNVVGAPRSGLSLKKVLTKLCRSVLKLSVAERCAVFILSEDGRTIEAMLGVGGSVPVRWEGSNGPTVSQVTIPQVIDILNNSEKPIIRERVPGSGLLPEECVKRFNVKSLAAYPLAYSKRAVGMMVVYNSSGFLSFPQEEVATLSAIAKQAAVIIGNARLYEREQRQRKRSETLTTVLAAATSTLSLRQVLSKVCEAALELTVGDDVSIFLVDSETGAARPMMAFGRGGPEALRRFLNAPQQLAHAPETRRTYRAIVGRKKPLVIEDATSSPMIGSWWVENFGIKSVVYYPLRVKDKTIGSMTVASTSDGVRFPPEEIDTLAAVAKQAAVIIENARLYEREQRQRKRSETLTKVLTAATSTLGLREVLSKVCEATLTLTVGDGVSIFLVDDATGGSVPMMAAGRRHRGTLSKFLSAPPEATSDPPSLRLFRTMARRNQPLVIENARASPFIGAWWLKEFGVKSLVAYPLRVKGKAIGAMTVDAEKDDAHFPREEIDTLAAVARQVSVIIENARLYEREQRQRQQNERLTKVLTAASETLSLRQVCAKVCEAALELTVGDTVSVFLRSDDGGFAPVSALGRGSPEELKMFLDPPPEVRSTSGIRLFDRMLAKRRKPYIIEDAPNSPHTTKWWVENFRLKSLAYYPLRAKDKMIGFMTVAATEEKRRFSQEEIDTLAAVAKQAAVIIENARLYERQQTQRQRAEALVGVLTAAASTLSLKKVLAQLCQAVVDISVADRCSIFLMAEDGTHLEPVMALGLEDPDLWEKFRNPRPGFEFAPESMRVFQSMTTMEEPIIAEDAPSSPFLERWWVETFNIKSLVQYPLRVKDRTIGMMSVDAFRHPVRFPTEEIDTIAAIAKQAAVVIENTRVYEREQQQHQRAEALVGVLTTAASTLGLNKVLVKICQTAVDVSVGDRCSIFIVGEDGRLKPMMSLGVEDPEAWERFRNAQALAGSRATSPDLRRFYGAVTKMEDPVIIEDAPSSPLIPKWWLDAFQVKSLVHYPLRIKDRTIGLMDVDAFRQPVHFPKEEIDTLAAIAKQAAVVIENARLHEQLQEQAITDHITGLFNHRHIFERLDEEFARAARSNSTFAVMMMDVDRFKDFNDTYGHLEGDDALKFIGQRLRETLRATDIIGRYGGDEFLAILPDVGRDDAEEAGNRIMSALADTPFTWEDSDESVTIAMSIGIACYPQDSQTRDELVVLADSALYEAKRLGGSRALPVSTTEIEGVPAQSLGFGLLQSLLNAIAHKDPYTRRHCEDNVRYVDLIANRLQLTPEATESLRKAALLHDVGKIAIPDQTLLKPGPLDSSEWEVMQQHVRFGEMIVRGIAQISDAIEPVATHHERFDGKGYPRGMKGMEIPFLGRILAVVDAYSAMTLDRPYRKALSGEIAVEELRKGSGTQFDPDIVHAFLETLEAARGPRRKVA